MRPRILVIDDEKAICVTIKYKLCKDYDVCTALSRAEAFEAMSKDTYQLALLDVFLGDDDGVELIRELKEKDPNIIVIVMTAHGSIRSSVSAMKAGAFTYMTKPLDLEELCIFIKQGLDYRSLHEKVAYLSDELQNRYQYGEMIGKSPAMQNVYRMVERLKDLDTPVVVTGESGTGKELVARALHYLGTRKGEKFIEVNCAAIPEGLLEMEFFGYRRGAFTGAVTDKKGKFEAADKGTIFLDEIGDMPLSLQSKLLRVLQEKSFAPLGSNEKKNIDVRVIAATNQDLQELVKNGKFRQDLYYRINVINIVLPSLRDRQQDIPLLVNQFINEFNREHGKQISGTTRDVERLLLTHDYPGNVRELKNIVEFSTIMCSSECISLEDLPPYLTGGRNNAANEIVPEIATLYQIEKQAILHSLQRNNGNQRKTATELGISERGLHNKLKEYGYKKE